MATLTKSLKLKIRKPVDNTWDDFGKILRDLRYNSSKIFTTTIIKAALQSPNCKAAA